MLKKVAVFISGGGSNLQALIDYKGNYQISLVISSKKNAGGLDRARNHHIDAMHIGKKNFEDKEARDAEIMKALDDYNIDIIVLAGYLTVLSNDLVSKYKNKIINIHAALIPSFCGLGFYGERVHKAVYENGVKVTGATVHFVNEGVDTGEIILQEAVMLDDNDTPEVIAAKVLKIEHKIFPIALNLLCNEQIKILNNRTYIGG